MKKTTVKKATVKKAAIGMLTGKPLRDAQLAELRLPSNERYNIAAKYDDMIVLDVIKDNEDSLLRVAYDLASDINKQNRRLMTKDDYKRLLLVEVESMISRYRASFPVKSKNVPTPDDADKIASFLLTFDLAYALGEDEAVYK
jgi:hypothetical protein